MVTTLLVLFLVFTFINILFYIGYFSFASARSSNTEKSRISVPISVIICAKNEAENLQKNLDSILKQEYPDFEVILINDASTDETLEVMEGFAEKDPRIRIVNVQNNEAFWANKKYSLTLGIKKAKNNFLLFTDADCIPASEYWITGMSARFTQEKSIVLGYGGYLKKSGSFLNKLIRFETLLTAIQYFSYSKWGIPYMGVGRNLAYTAKEFYDQNGFATHLQIRSGDDDLFVNHAANSTNTAVCFEKEALTLSIPKTSFKAWITQKRRHISTAKHYKTLHKILLATFYSSQFLFWLLLILLLALQLNWQIVLGIFIVRLAVQFLIFYKSAKKLNEKDLVWIFPILEVILISTQLGIFITNIFSKPTHWK